MPDLLELTGIIRNQGNTEAYGMRAYQHVHGTYGLALFCK